MIALVKRHPINVEASLRRVWQSVEDTSALVIASAAENIRTVLYGTALTRCNHDAIRTVHSIRLLASARRLVGLTWPKYAFRQGDDKEVPVEDACGMALESMRTLGDAVDTGGGHWLAAPLRLIAPEGARRFLLVGAAPAEAVYQRLGFRPTCAGASRFVESTELESDDIVQPTDIWLGETQPLGRWTAQCLAQHEVHMKPLEGLVTDQLEIYAPDVARSQYRAGRWLPAGQIGRPLNEIRLCRPRESYARVYDRPHYLGHFTFKNGALTLRRFVAIERDLTLRLRFGLDGILNTPRKIAIIQERDMFFIERPLALPSPEKRVYALGWHDLDGRAPSDILTFHAHALPFVTHALRRLCLLPTIVTRSTQ